MSFAWKSHNIKIKLSSLILLWLHHIPNYVWDSILFSARFSNTLMPEMLIPRALLIPLTRFSLITMTSIKRFCISYLAIESILWLQVKTLLYYDFKWQGILPFSDMARQRWWSFQFVAYNPFFPLLVWLLFHCIFGNIPLQSLFGYFHLERSQNETRDISFPSLGVSGKA